MEPAEISVMVAEAVEKIKGAKMGIDMVVQSLTHKEREAKIPDFNPIYKKTVELMNRIAVHAEFDKIPYDIIRKRGPYEDDNQYRYRKENWQSITMPYFMKAFSSLNRIMNPSNYSIQWKEDQNEEKQYFENDIPTVSSIEDYAEQILLVQKILDPNSIVIFKPYSVPMKVIATENGQELYFDDSKDIRPIPVLIPCTHVVQYHENEYAIVIIEEKSKVRDGNKNKLVAEGIIFEIYDKESIYRVEQTGLKSKWEFTEPYVYYPHGLGYVPCQKLKGTLKQKDKWIYYQSYFLNAIPHLDTALYEHSNLDISTVTQMFPQRSELADRCDNNECDNGWVYSYRDIEGQLEPEGRGVRCGKCNGTGALSRLGPMSVKQIITPNGYNPNDPTSTPQLPGIAYTAPPAEPLKFVFDKFKHDVVAAFLFLNIDVSDSEVKGSDTALGKMIDRDELFSFLMRISNELFDLIEFSIRTIGLMRYGKDFKVPVISAPKSFQIRSDKDLTAELSESKKAGVPDIALRAIIREIISTRFSNQRDIEPIVNLAFAVDRIITANKVEAISMLAARTAHLWEVILHESLYTFIDEILIDDKDFFQKDYKAQRETLIAMAKSIADSLTPVVKTITDTVVDEERN